MSSSADAGYMTSQALFILSAGLASCKANSILWVPVAIVSGVVYLCVMDSLEFTHCASLIASKIGDADRIAVVTTATIDLVFSVLTILALLAWAYHYRLARGAPPAAVARVSPVRPTSHLDKVLRGVHVAPLRHHIAATLAFTFCVSATIALAIFGQQEAVVVAGVWSSFVDSFNVFIDEYNAAYPNGPPPGNPVLALLPTIITPIINVTNMYGEFVTIAVIELLWSAVIAASIACVVSVVSMSWSYHVICDDHAALEDFFANRPRDDALPNPAGVAGMAGTAVVQDVSASVAGSLTATLSGSPAIHTDAPVGNGTDGVAPPATGSSCCLCRRPTLFLDNNGTPDVSSNAFTYMDAFPYAALYSIKWVGLVRW